MNKTERCGAQCLERRSNLHTQFLLASWNPEFTGTHLWVMVAVLACLFAAEVFGIVVLVRKLMALRHPYADDAEDETEDDPTEAEEDVEESDESEDETADESVSSTYQYAVAPLFLTTIPPVTYAMLTVFGVLCALASVALVVLLAVLYVKGYDVTSRNAVADEVDEPVEAAEEIAPVAEEESAEMMGEVMAPAPFETVTTTVRTAEAIPPENGQGPYKVVEKIVTETYKEIVKEAPAPEGTSADEVLKKISNLLDYELEKRKAADAASVAAFAQTAMDMDEDEDESDEDDELDADETAEEIPNEENVSTLSLSKEDRFTGTDRIIGFDEATGCYLVAHYRKSFEAKLIQADPHIKKYYSELKNALLSYKGTKSRVSWTADSFHNGRTPLAKINVKTRILEIYFAIDPATLEGTVYRGRDVGDKKKYADTPFQYKIRTPRKFKWAMELVTRMCEEHGLTPIDIEPVAYEEKYVFDTTDNLVKRKLIKEYIKQQKPATSFELADDHVTAVPDEDPSVIPANANFSWELDNETMTDPARNVEAEPVAPVETETKTEETAEAPAKQAPVYKETVKVTEVKYTEHYYANGDVLTIRESEKELAAPTDEPAEEAAEDLPEETYALIDEIEDRDEDVADEAADEAQEDSDEERFFDTEEALPAWTQTAEEDECEEVKTISVEEIVMDEPVEAEIEDETPFVARVIPKPADPEKAVVDVCILEENFPDGAVITLEKLRAVGLVQEEAKTLQIIASDSISKSFTIEADRFTIDAMRVIDEANGNIVVVTHQGGFGK